MVFEPELLGCRLYLSMIVSPMTCGHAIETVGLSEKWTVLRLGGLLKKHVLFFPRNSPSVTLTYSSTAQAIISIRHGLHFAIDTCLTPTTSVFHLVAEMPTFVAKSIAKSTADVSWSSGRIESLQSEGRGVCPSTQHDSVEGKKTYPFFRVL